MPPALRNHRPPTAGDTPASIAASSVERPAAIDAQNLWWCSRRAAGGRPGDLNGTRPHRSERRLRLAIAFLLCGVLRRPFEFTQHAADLYRKAWMKWGLNGPTRESIRQRQSREFHEGAVIRLILSGRVVRVP